MATEALKASRSIAAPIKSRMVLFNAVVFILGVGACLGAGVETAKGYAAGYAIGVVSLLWLLRIASRGLKLRAENAARYVAIRYYLRFAVVAGLFIILIKNGVLNPWSPVIGLSASIFATIGALVMSAREEAG